MKIAILSAVILGFMGVSAAQAGDYWYRGSEPCTRYATMIKWKNQGKSGIDISPWYELYSTSCQI